MTDSIPPLDNPFRTPNEPQLLTSGSATTEAGNGVLTIDLTNSSEDEASAVSSPSEVKKEEPVFSPDCALDDPFDPSLCEPPPIGEDARSIFPFALTPVRNIETQLYTDGKYKAAELQTHFDPKSIPILDTPNSGTLHVITGWNASEVLSDSCYRYKSKGKWETTSCGFLKDTFPMLKRRYSCNGSVVCPIMMKNIQCSSHATEQEWNALQSIVRDRERQVELDEMRKSRSVFVTITNPGAQFCTARWTIDGGEKSMSGSSFHSTSIGKCDGKPIIRQVRATGEWFIGCTKYYHYRNVHKAHYFESLRTFTDRARGYLSTMLAKNEPMVIPGDVCEYVAVKKGRIRKRCATHGVELIGSGTSVSESGKCSATMILTEPQIPNTNSSYTPVTFAMCVGAHNHPPPPQPLSTEKKMKAFRELAEKSPTTPASVLKLQVQTALNDGRTSTMQNLQFSKNAMYGTLSDVRRLQMARRNEEGGFKSLFEMVGKPDMPYVRDVRVVKKGSVFLLATEKMLGHAIQGRYFAGDATYKTVLEKTGKEITPEWYLYNIVTPQDATTATHKGVVVCRALCTTLSAEAYHAIWYMFMKAMREERASQLGLPVGDISIDVPYMVMEPSRKQVSVPIHTITTDFEAAEIRGIAAAFSEQRGGSADMHLSNLMVGCQVHFERAAQKRCVKLDAEQGEKFYKACIKLIRATSLDVADEQYAIIASIDEAWGKWLSESHIRPLVSAPYSGVSKSDRMFSLRNTNIVESQNRRANLICGTQLPPVTCALKLMELDTVSADEVTMNDGVSGQRIPRIRTRNGHTLAPSGVRGNERGRKRKGSTGTEKPRTKKSARVRDLSKTSSDGGIMSKGTGQGKDAEALLWLHDDLGNRCIAALEEGNNELLAALSDLYSYVIECGDINKIKYRLLGTIKNGGTEKEVVKSFTEILSLTTKNKLSYGSGSCVKDEPAVEKVQGTGRADESSNSHTTQIPIVHID